MARLAGRIAIVTGGARGIGRHYSQALAAEAAEVMIADIADGAELAEEIAAKHGRNAATSMTCDVSDEDAVKALVARTLERFGKIDILVNNAALFASLTEQPFTDIDAALWDRVMAVNIRGPFLMAKHVVPHMRAVGGDGICVNTLAPGFTLSDSVIDDNPSHVESSRQPAIQRRAIKRDGFPQDLLGALVFLASADSDFITGQTIAVDGGA